MWHRNCTRAQQCVSALSALPPFFFFSSFAHGTPCSRSNWICMDQNPSLIDSEASMPRRRQVRGPLSWNQISPALKKQNKQNNVSDSYLFIYLNLHFLGRAGGGGLQGFVDLRWCLTHVCTDSFNKAQAPLSDLMWMHGECCSIWRSQQGGNLLLIRLCWPQTSEERGCHLLAPLLASPPCSATAERAGEV